jgi:hypothetical protein
MEKPHVATVEEEEKYVPRRWRERLNQPDMRDFEMVWMVTQRDGLLYGDLIDTERNLWARVDIIKVDPEDDDTWTMANIEDKWQPLHDPNE